MQLALAGAGCRAVAPDHYSVRGGRFAAFDMPLRQAGLRPVRKGKPGDILLVQAGVEQFHLMIAVAGGHVHAHAGLGRVVEMPGASPWPVVGRWRWGR